MANTLTEISANARSMPGGLRGILAAIHAAFARDVAVALALVVETQGSTYRKSGALALVAADGMCQGVLSGGCLEPEIARIAHQALVANEPCIMEFNTTQDEDLIFGSGSGCRGWMRVLITPFTNKADPRLIALEESITQNQPLRVTLTIDPPQWLSPQLNDIASLALVTPSRYEVTIAPPPHILLIGAGAEAPSLTRLAHELGWWITLGDHRSGMLTPTRLPTVDHFIIARPARVVEQLTQQHFSAAVVMTHLATADREALSALADSNIGYIGLLGPPARRDELLACLSEHQRIALQARLVAPVGLPLGGEGPEAIALAIVAELQQFFTAHG